MASSSSIVLIPVDFSEASELAFARGLELAERLSATVELVYVAPEAKPLFPGFAPNRKAAERLAKEEEDYARDALEELQKRSELVVSTKVLRGSPHQEIVTHADKIGAELIAIGTLGHSLPGTVILGSTTERVLRHATIPVVVFPVRLTPENRSS